MSRPRTPRPSATQRQPPSRTPARSAARTSRRHNPGVLDRGLGWARRHPWPVVLGLVALHLVFAALAFVPVLHPGGDNAVYLALARSLLDGGYRDLFDPARPVHTQFPPGWPLMIAAGLTLGLKPWVGPKLIVVAFSAAAVALTYFWIRRRRRPDLALGVAFLVAVSPGVVALSHWELSDVPFWAITTAALLAWERLPRGRNGRAALAAVLTVCAYLTRSAGLPLMLAAAVWLAFRRRWAQLGIYLAVVAPPTAAWLLWTRAQGGYATLIAASNAYAPDHGTVQGAGGLLDRFGENAVAYTGRFLPTLLADAATAPVVALSVAIIALAIYGWSRRVRRPGVAELWVPLYVGMLLAWNPQWSGERLLLPLYPALLMYAGDGVTRLGRMAPAVWRGAGRFLAPAALLLAALPGLAGAVRDGSTCRAASAYGAAACLAPAWQDFLEIAAYAGRELPANAVVLSRKPALFYAESGLPGRTYPLTREPAALIDTARRAGARYLLLDNLDEVSISYLTPILIRRPAAFCVLHALGPERAALIGIVPNAAAVPDARADPGETEADVAFQPCGPEYRR
ncbi:MAG TPA: hypothetical protein VFS20_06265 [Longimicrobium sp.]|nr:hypothetical protein [Longimicrobium sp.]